MDDLLAAIEPFDLLMFHGALNVSKLIMASEDLAIGHAEWSHVGIVVTTDVIPIKNGVPGRKYI